MPRKHNLRSNIVDVPASLDIGPFCEDITLNFNNSIDRHVESVYKEDFLLLSTNYSLNKLKSKWVSVGLSVIRNFTPVMKFTTTKPNNVGIQFDLFQLKELMVYKEVILNYLKNGLEMMYQSLPNDVGMILNNVNGKKLLTLSWHANQYTIVLDAVSAQTVFNISEVIIHKLNMLSSLNFNVYYEKILSLAHDYFTLNLNDSEYKCIETVLDKDINMNVLAFKELLCVYKGNKMYNDMINKRTN